MNKHRNLRLVVGFLLIGASAGIGQVNPSKPGDAVEHHLSSDQTASSLSPTKNSRF